MCDQTIPYSPGTLVWVKTYNRLWWPGRVVDPTSTPQDLQNFIKRKKNPIAVVHFEKDDQYDIVVNMDKVFLYSCPRKLEFLEKGYSLYVKQKQSVKTPLVDMNNFVADVIKYEGELNGNKKIFEQFENKKDELAPRRELIKELFSSSKDTKKKEAQKASLSLKPTVNRPHSTTVQSKYKSFVSATQNSSGGYSGNYTCQLKAGCNFTSHQYDALKRHMAICRTIVEDVKSAPKNKTKKGINTKTLFQTQNKRKSGINKTPAKKTKIHVELLKDWEDEDEDEDDNKTPINHAESGVSNEQTKSKTIFDFDEVKGNDKIVPHTTSQTIGIEEYNRIYGNQGTSKNNDTPRKLICAWVTGESIPRK
ncbi:PWWP domain [Cinara cedri]|uniref:PWWP domain n=1 Tax=Cinara cedri TaxID=506608 RepID=A0A5E4M9I6_9HEMI|nr:PWWP domain [Cinara cedri]